MLDLWLGRKIKRVCWRVCGGGERERERERECQRMQASGTGRVQLLFTWVKL